VHPNTEVKNLSNATTLLWQPLKQGPTCNLAAITLVVLDAVFWMQVKETFVSVSECWKSMTLKGCWKKLWSEVVSDI